MSGQSLHTCECGEVLLFYGEHAAEYDHQANKLTCKKLLQQLKLQGRCQCNHLKYSHRDGWKDCVRCHCTNFKAMNRSKP